MQLTLVHVTDDFINSGKKERSCRDQARCRCPSFVEKEALGEVIENRLNPVMPELAKIFKIH